MSVEGRDSVRKIQTWKLGWNEIYSMLKQIGVANAQREGRYKTEDRLRVDQFLLQLVVSIKAFDHQTLA